MLLLRTQWRYLYGILFLVALTGLPSWIALCPLWPASTKSLNSSQPPPVTEQANSESTANSFLPASNLSAPDQADQERISQAYGKLPLSFEANDGQTDGQVKFLSRGNGYKLFLTSTEAVLTLTTK